MDNLFYSFVFQRQVNSDGTQWVPVVVERDGVHPIGVAPPNFPASRAAIGAMSNQAITALESQFNLPAGYFGHADVPTRRDNVLAYLTRG